MRGGRVTAYPNLDVRPGMLFVMVIWQRREGRGSVVESKNVCMDRERGEWIRMERGGRENLAYQREKERYEEMETITKFAGKGRAQSTGAVGSSPRFVRSGKSR